MGSNPKTSFPSPVRKWTTGVMQMKLKVYNTTYERRTSYFFEIPEFNFYDGEEVKVKWAKPEELAIKTDDEVGLRIIQRKNIREIDGKPYSFEVKAKKEEVRLVQGSNGKVYEVTSHSCTCPGFTFRGTCKHVNQK
jgi:hypothetical protein